MRSSVPSRDTFFLWCKSNTGLPPVEVEYRLYSNVYRGQLHHRRAASKATQSPVFSMTKSLAMAHTADGIRVNLLMLNPCSSYSPPPIHVIIGRPVVS